MNKKIKLSAAVITMLMLSILAINVAMATPTLTTATRINTTISPANAQVTAETGVVISDEQVQNPELLRNLVPATLEEAERNILPIRTRFLMWTNDGVHIMWGVFRKGYFTGTDNLGKKCWGIYGRGVFAGFYDGKFFWGKYSNGAWKAQYLFGLETSYGKYVTFPPIAVAIPYPVPYPTSVAP